MTGSDWLFTQPERTNEFLRSGLRYSPDHVMWFRAIMNPINLRGVTIPRQPMNMNMTRTRLRIQLGSAQERGIHS